jgi:hypothetical protein
MILIVVVLQLASTIRLVYRRLCGRHIDIQRVAQVISCTIMVRKVSLNANSPMASA